MRADELESVQKRFMTIHIGIQTVMLFHYAVLFANREMEHQIWGFLFTAVLAGFDILASRLRLWKHKILFLCLRSLQLILYTYIFIYSSNGYIVLLCFPILFILMLELILHFDYSDAYLRGLAMLVAVIPAFVFLLIRLFAMQTTQNVLIGTLCALCVLIFFVYLITGMVADVLSVNEEKLFEQCRLADSTRQANAALQEQQQKVKKANELLGLQKIKLESANNQIKRVNSEMMLQYSILKYIASTLEIENLMQMITDAVYEGMVLELCAVEIKAGIADNETNISYAKLRCSRPLAIELQKKLQEGCLDSYCTKETPYLDHKVSEEKYPFFQGTGLGSIMIIPIYKNRKLLASLIFGHQKQGYFQENRSFYETIAAQFSIALDNAQMYTKMQQMAIRDGLTGVYNRGHLNNIFEEYCKNAAGKHEDLTVALFDIDHFKQVNDTYGHLFGDLVIKTIARLAKATASNHGGITARYGGEEFVIVFPDKGVEECYKIVEGLRQKIRDTKLEYNGVYVGVRVSVGLTSYPETSATPYELLNNADWAMYYSKQSGRDRVTIDSEEVRKQVKNAAGA